MNDQKMVAREATTQAPERPRVQKRKIIPVIVILIIGVATLLYWLSTRGRVSTDDAQVNGDLVPISARTSGYVRRILVDDNQQVQNGQLLVELDQRDLTARLNQQQADLATQRAQAAAAAGQEALVGTTAPATAEQATAAVNTAQSAVSTAREQIASAQDQARSAQAAVGAAQAAVVSARSDVESAAAQITAAQAAVKAAQADVGSAKAQAQRTASDAARYQDLFSRGAASKQSLELAQATNTSAQESLAAARERVASAQANLSQTQARRSSAIAAVSQATSRLSAAKAAASQAQTGIRVAQSSFTSAQSQLKQAQAAQAGASTVPQQLTVAESQRKAALARAQQSAANLRNAQLQLSYTLVNAPVAGMITMKSVQLGQFVQPGQQLMAIVPLSNVWVTANFKETQIKQMHPGQRATVEVDTYPGQEFEGVVQGVGAATQAKGSLIPSENATGNFVKVVQRFPVKILITQRLPKGVVFRPGANVTATVYVDGGK